MFKLFKLFGVSLHRDVSQKVHDVGGGNVEGHKLPQRLKTQAR